MNDVLGKLSTIEIGGKKHIEKYIRYQYRCHFQANKIMNSYKSLRLFLRFIQQIGKARTEDVERRDQEAFVEHEQDRGMKLSTVRMRLAKVIGLWILQMWIRQVGGQLPQKKDHIPLPVETPGET